MTFLFPRLKQSIIIVLIIVCSINTFSQKKYPSLLWEIWLKNMKDIGLLEQLNNPNTYANANFYKDAFKIELPDNKRYADILSNDPDIINNLLYRNNNNRNDHEESTYIDLFIYKAGSKLDKKIVSLEDFKTSLIMATKSTIRDPNEVYDESKNKVDYRKVQDDINNAYRTGDLDLIDSLTQLTYTTKNTQKYLIEDRNVILAHNIDSVSKTGSLFAGIGAAHLPGKNGVIELLRKMGYTLRPISNTATKKGTKQKEKIEAIIKKWPSSKHYSKDSLFSFELYDAPISIANLKGYSFALTTDMANGSYYTIARQISYAPMMNYNVDKLILKIDSLLYESIPGKIVTKKNIVSNTGLKGIDIVNKTKRGDFQRYQIYFTDIEMIVFKMSGKGEYVTGAEGNRFFASIKFTPDAGTKAISFSPPTKGFSATIPPLYKYNSNKKTGIQGLSEELFAFDPTSKNCTGMMHYFYHDFNYLEEDTFELNILCNNILKNFGDTANITRQLTREQNLPCINFSGTNTKLNQTLYGKLLIKGVHYYLAYAIVDKSAPKPVEYFNSFKLMDFKHINELKEVTDDDFAFKVIDEIVPEDRNQLQEGLADFYAQIQKEKDSKLISNAFNFESKSKTYYSPSSGEHVNIDYEKYNDYDYRDPKEYWEDIKKYLKSNTSFIVSHPVFHKSGETETLEVILKDTASTNMIKRKYILKDGLLFCLSAVCDSTTGTTGWTDGFLKSFKHKDTVFTKPIFENKVPALLRDLTSKDTTLKYAAKQTLAAIAINKKFSKLVIDFIKSPDFLKLDEESRAMLLVNGGTLEDETIIPVYKTLYTYYEDSSYMQICLIKGLGYLKTPNSYNTIFDLLKNKTPLTGSEDNIVDVLSPIYDSLQLCANYFPGLFSLTSFEEYKTPIYKLFSDLVIRGIIPPSKYQANLPNLLMEAGNELKRYNTSSNKSSKNTNSYDAQEEADRMADYLSNMYSESADSTKKTYPSYSTMIENHAAVLAPFYQTNPGVKQYFDKLFKIKNEQTLLNIYLIAAKNNIPVNDTVWKHFSNNNQTKLKTYNELSKLKQLHKFDKTKLSQEEFCKTSIEISLEYEGYSEDDENVKQKSKPDSIAFLRKEYVKNNREEGYIYFFNRIDNKTKVKSLAYAFVKKQKDDKITTQIDITDIKRVIDIGKTTEDIITSICSEFYFKNRLRYISENSYSNYSNLYQE
ncbi:MAG: TraB/GumN family protein [Bacteroidetes bacterium]|nr:TraB/GumN family protein [Bacteroidota bacterium]